MPMHMRWLLPLLGIIIIALSIAARQPTMAAAGTMAFMAPILFRDSPAHNELSAKQREQEWLWEPDGPLELPAPDDLWVERSIRDFRKEHYDLAYAARREYARGKVTEADLEAAVERAFQFSEPIPTNDPAWVSIFGEPETEREILEAQARAAFRTPTHMMILEDSHHGSRSWAAAEAERRALREEKLRAKDKAVADYLLYKKSLAEVNQSIKATASECADDQHHVYTDSHTCELCGDERFPFV